VDNLVHIEVRGSRCNRMFAGRVGHCVLQESAHGNHHGLWKHPVLLKLANAGLNGRAKLSHRRVVLAKRSLERELDTG
jgi:hypothetical protein